MSKTKYPTIAKEDIIVYKVLRSDFTSLCRKFQYELNKLYTESECIDFEFYFEDIKCFSFSTGWFHSFGHKELAEKFMEEGLILVKCIIPKGTAYLRDDYIGDYLCSKSIKIISIENVEKNKHYILPICPWK